MCVPVHVIILKLRQKKIGLCSLRMYSVFHNEVVYQDSVAGSVIQASGMVLFEDGLKPGTLVVDIWSAASVRTTPVVNLAPHGRSHPDLGVQCGVEVA